VEPCRGGDWGSFVLSGRPVDDGQAHEDPDDRDQRCADGPLRTGRDHPGSPPVDCVGQRLCL
jgi:hypothetical protein